MYAVWLSDGNWKIHSVLFYAGIRSGCFLSGILMSPPLLNVEEGEESRSNVTLLASPSSMESVSQNNLGFEERNYMGLSVSSSEESCMTATKPNGNNHLLNLKATELRLGIPGSESPERDPDISFRSSSQLDEKTLFPLHPSGDGRYSSPHKAVVSGNKRGFSDAMNEFSEVKLPMFCFVFIFGQTCSSIQCLVSSLDSEAI